MQNKKIRFFAVVFILGLATSAYGQKWLGKTELVLNLSPTYDNNLLKYSRSISIVLKTGKTKAVFISIPSMTCF
jgi:hypothetical protein